MKQAYLAVGSLTDSRTIHLDEPIPVATGKVRVMIEMTDIAPKMSHDEFLTWLQERQEATWSRPTHSR